MKFLVLALVAVAVVLGAKCMTIRGDLASERQVIDADWVQVDTALAHRAGIIPDLIGTVQAGAPAEAGVIGAVGEARNALSAGQSRREKIRANARLDESLARLMLQVENYPKLEGSGKYADLLEA